MKVTVTGKTIRDWYENIGDEYYIDYDNFEFSAYEDIDQPEDTLIIEDDKLYDTKDIKGVILRHDDKPYDISVSSDLEAYVKSLSISTLHVECDKSNVAQIKDLLLNAGCKVKVQG